MGAGRFAGRLARRVAARATRRALREAGSTPPARNTRGDGPAGTDMALLLGSVLFDEQWYSRQTGRSLGRAAAVRHYLAEGHRQGHSPHPLFDPGTVRRRWSPARLRELGEGDPLTLYLRKQVFARSPHPLFDRDHYLRQAPEAIEHPAGPVGHYAQLGVAAGLTPNDWLEPGEDLCRWIDEAYGEVAGDPGQMPGPPSGQVGVSVLIVAEDAEGPLAAVRRLLADPAGGVRDIGEILVLDHATSVLTGLSLHALRRHPEVRLARVTERRSPPAARTELLASAAGETVVFLDGSARPADGWLPPLLAALEDPSVGAAQPVLLRPDGTVRGAGVAFPGGGAGGYPMLEGFPPEDSDGLAGQEFCALQGAVVAVRSDTAAAVADDGGVLVRREAVGGSLRVVPQSTSVLGAELSSTYPSQENADDERLWAACGFAVESRNEHGRPQLRWTGMADGPPPVRWAIKNPAPSGPVGEVWGDTHFARSLARELRALGAHVTVDHAPAWHRPSEGHDHVALVIRGPKPFTPRAGGTPLTLTWVISHPDAVTADELRAYDVVAAASSVWAEQRSAEWGIPIETLHQATDAELFTPDAAEPDSGPALLFVGNSREVYRDIVRDAVESGLPLTIYGRGWHHFLPPEAVAGYRLDNDRLSAAYRSAGILLNDHFEDMRRGGFLSNRLFDAVASGARVVTDEVAGIGAIFGDSVQVYRSRDDLVRLATRPDLDAVFGDDAARRRTAERIRHEHSFAARARRLVEIATSHQERAEDTTTTRSGHRPDTRA